MTIYTFKIILFIFTAPTDAPTMVNSKSYSETELVLEWDPVDDSNFQGVLTGYRVRFISDLYHTCHT